MAKEEEQEAISRRKFLKASSFTGAGVAVLGNLLAGTILTPAQAHGFPIAAVTVASGPNQAAASITIYVSPEGQDCNSGTREKPLATIQRARDKVRAIKKSSEGPIEVVLAPGSYYLGETLVFGAEDSGTGQARITYRAAEDGTVTISGGMRIKGVWEAYRDGIFVCDVPEAKGGQVNFSELYVNGRRQIRARYPKGDSRIPQPTGYIRTKDADHNWPNQELYFDPTTFTQKHWAHPEEAVAFVFQRISFDRVPFWSGQWHVRGIDRSRNAILLGEGGRQQLLFHYMQAYQPGIYPEMPFYIENVFEELDAPGEWYLDRREGKLYYMPAEGVDLKTALVVAALLQRVIEVKGTKGNPVRHLTLRGVHVAHAASTYFEPYAAAGMGDYTIQYGGATFIEGAEDITVDRCSLEGVSGNGFFVNGYARRVRLTNSRLADIGESGICFIGKQIYRTDLRTKCPMCGFENWWGWDEETDEIPVDCEATNNLVHDVGVFAKQCGGVFMANCQRLKMTHNHIYNTPRAGININNGRYGGHLFEYNDVHDTVRETSDHGPLNSYGRDPYWCQHVCHPGYVPKGWSAFQGGKEGVRFHSFGSFEKIAQYAKETTTIRNNRFSATRRGGNSRPGLQFGIDLDDGSANYEVCHNLCVDLGIKTKEGVFIKIHDNVMINGELRFYQANRDNYVIGTANTSLGVPFPSEIEDEYTKGRQFGLTEEFPAMLRDTHVSNPINSSSLP